MLTGSSKLTLDIPRDRLGTFDPKLIAKYQRRFLVPYRQCWTIIMRSTIGCA
jgi:transposase-like protein